MNEFAKKRLWGPVPSYPKLESYQSPYKDSFITVAGPCSVESPAQIHDIARELQKHDIRFLRGGIFRAGTYPNPTRGLGFVKEDLIVEFARAAHENGMRVVMEVLDYSPESLRIYDKYGDAYQVGARQMQNYTLLDLLSRKKRPVFLKRNMGAKVDELLGAAEWLIRNGLCDPILVERGSMTFMNHARYELALSVIGAVKAINSTIPVLVDASHGTGRRDLVESMTLAGVAAGAKGFMIETHPIPDESLTDSEQAFPLDQFGTLVRKVNRIREVLR